jgi:hypothetical protein
VCKYLKHVIPLFGNFSSIKLAYTMKAEVQVGIFLIVLIILLNTARTPPFIARSLSRLDSFTSSQADFSNKLRSINSSFQALSLSLRGMCAEMGSNALDIFSGFTSTGKQVSK